MGLAPFGWGDTGMGVKPSNGSGMERRFLQSPCRSAASVLPTHSNVGFLGRNGDAPKLSGFCHCHRAGAVGLCGAPVLLALPPSRSLSPSHHT